MTLRPRHAPRRSPRVDDFTDDARLRVLVFGPGHGEAIIVILPDRSLGVVDGCREPTDGNAAGRGDPVREFIGAWLACHPDCRIRFVALTHPHGDHYAGLGRLIEAHDDRIDALWRTLVAGDRWGEAYIAYARYCDLNTGVTPTAGESSGLERVYAAFQTRRPRVKILAPGVPLIDTRFNRRSFSVHSVAPSMGDVDRGNEALQRFLYDRQTSSLDPNLLSAALVIRWGDAGVLLGGDLLCASGSYEGWAAAAPMVDAPIQVIKAAHHASEEAQDWSLWRRMAPELAIVTPFKSAGGGHPPRPEMLSSIARHASRTAVTSVPRWVRDGAPGPPRTPIGRNQALRIDPDVQAVDSAVCVSLDPSGMIVDLLLTGAAWLHR